MSQMQTTTAGVMPAAPAAKSGLVAIPAGRAVLTVLAASLIRLLIGRLGRKAPACNTTPLRNPSLAVEGKTRSNLDGTEVSVRPSGEVDETYPGELGRNLAAKTKATRSNAAGFTNRSRPPGQARRCGVKGGCRHG